MTPADQVLDVADLAGTLKRATDEEKILMAVFSDVSVDRLTAIATGAETPSPEEIDGILFGAGGRLKSTPA